MTNSTSLIYGLHKVCEKFASKKVPFSHRKKKYSQESMYTFMELSITMFNASKNPSSVCAKKGLGNAKRLSSIFLGIIPSP